MSPTVQIRNVTKKFGSFIAVDNLDLSIGKGEFFGFLGPNGAGKTTTIKMITGLYAPSSGTCLINGFDVHRDPVPAKRSLGYVPDQPFLYEKLTGDFAFSWPALAGVKFPTGAPHHLNPAEPDFAPGIGGHDLALGSGSFDGVLGTGFFSFWLKYRDAVKAEGIPQETAHNGYLEMYLDGGIIGCALLGIFLLTTCWRMAGAFSADNSFTRAMFVFAMMALIANFTETYFFRLDPLWFAVVFSAFAIRAVPLAAPAQQLVREEPVA